MVAIVDTRNRTRSRPAVLEFSIADVGEAVSCAPDFLAKVVRWKNRVESSKKVISLDDINIKLDRARLMRKVCPDVICKEVFLRHCPGMHRNHKRERGTYMYIFSV
jgi:hypothetical protein